MSEASTTDDYATATENNSDGGSRVAMKDQQSGTATCSFESGSSLYSLTRADTGILEEQQVSEAIFLYDYFIYYQYYLIY